MFEKTMEVIMEENMLNIKSNAKKIRTQQKEEILELTEKEVKKFNTFNECDDDYCANCSVIDSFVKKLKQKIEEMR